MTLTLFDIWACEQVYKWEHPQHSFLHNIDEDLGNIVHDVVPIAEEILPIASTLI